MELFLGLLRMISICFLLPAFLICFAFGWAHRWQTKRAFHEILLRALLISLGFGLPICAVFAAGLTWWVICHVPAPD
jgi:hypothetical protein